MLMSALQSKFTVGQLANERFSDLFNAMYQQGMLDYYKRQTDLTASGQVLEAHKNRIAAANTYLDYLQEANEDDRTVFQQDYEYAKGKGFKGSPADWKTLSADPTSWQEYKKAVDESGYTGTYPDFLLKYKRSDTTINIDKTEQALDLSYIEARNQLYDPEARAEAIDRELANMGVEQRIMARMQGSDSPEVKAMMTDVVKAALRKIIVAGRGVIKNEGFTKDGKSIVFLVEWTNRDGTTSQEVITHAIE